MCDNSKTPVQFSQEKLLELISDVSTKQEHEKQARAALEEADKRAGFTAKETRQARMSLREYLVSFDMIRVQ